MGADSKIEWTTHTFNPWVGCTKVSAACDHCYAESWAKRSGHPELWTGERRRTSASNWQQPIKWNRLAEGLPDRPRVFCASLADVFDNQVPERWRDDLWHLIDHTPNLDWLLLTKRPQNIAKMLPTPAIGAPDWGNGWSNVWLGTTVENQEEADRRIPHLLDVPARVRFLSCEPLLGPIDLTPKADNTYQMLSEWYGDRGFDPTGSQPRRERIRGYFPRIDWVICGGESGGHARPMHPDWARSLRDQCAIAGVPFFLKQWGEWVEERQSPEDAIMPAVGRVHFWGDTQPGVWRIGKKAAGRLLDGRTWDQFPSAARKELAG